jgi:hypothetical protein
MHTDQIVANLQELNQRQAKRPAVKNKKPAPPKAKAEVYGEEWLRQAAARIAAALHLEDRGINAEALVTAVHNHEAAVREVVQ